MIWRILPLLLAFVHVGQATAAPPSGGGHILELPYSADDVVPLRAAPGYAILVELSDDERVETIVVGTTAGWQVSANKRGDNLVVKAGMGAAPTNLVVTTDVRRYVFLLAASDLTPSTPFVVHFAYPEIVASMDVAAPTTAYHFTGDKRLFPVAMSDDGLNTSVSWSTATRLPAIYATDADGNEALVNGRMVDDTYVIQSVASAYIFRLGMARAVAHRDAGAAARR